MGPNTQAHQTLRVDVVRCNRPRQQHWLGWRTARAVLMQDYHAGAPVPAATKRGQVSLLQASDPCCVEETRRGGKYLASLSLGQHVSCLSQELPPPLAPGGKEGR